MIQTIGVNRSRLSGFTAIAGALWVLLGFVVSTAAPAGAVTRHYAEMAAQLIHGPALTCADVDWAAAQGLIEPVEVRWLNESAVHCNDQYEVMLVLGNRRQLTCADVEWNAAYGFLNWNQAAGLLWRVPGCVLTKYAFLVTLSAQGAITCVDVDWHLNVGLISPDQAGWLKAALAVQGKPCGVAPPAPNGPAPNGPAPNPPASPSPAPPAQPFGDGTHMVGSQIAPGRYIASGTAGCYWERLRGLSGSVSDIIANDFNAEGRVIVDIAASDLAFGSSNCGTWSPWTPTPGGPVGSFGSGSFVVGQEILPGRYQSNGASSSCYWKRMTGFGGSFTQILVNYFGPSPAIVDISPTDVGFNTSGCGAWAKIG